MNFLQTSQIIFYTSKKYEEIYIHLNSELKLGYKHIFLLCATLGAKNNRKSPIDNNGREFRSSYLTNEEENILYSIILNDSDIGRNIEAFNDRDSQVQMRKLLEQYAEGGMDILVDEVFKEKWNGIKLDDSYDEYFVDMLKYTLANLQSVPF